MLLHDKLKPYRLILASQSPRRRQLLADAGIEFDLAPRFECEESFPEELSDCIPEEGEESFPEEPEDSDLEKA